MITRRACLKLLAFSAAALVLPAGCRGNDRFRLTPGAVLADLRANEAIGKMRDCRLTFHPKFVEKLTDRGKAALTIIQRGLFVAGLIEAEPSAFNFGVYGPQTITAVGKLQQRSGRKNDGESFGCRELALLEAELTGK